MIQPQTLFELIPPGKLRCVVTGKWRNDTPEENVRQRIARSLMEDYGYDAVEIEVEFSIKVGSSSKRVDLAIFPPQKAHKQEHVSIIVECKRDDVRPTDRDNGIEQLKSYLSACLNARFGMWIGAEFQVWERFKDPDGTERLEPASDIPHFGQDAPQPLTFDSLVPAQEELIGVFKRCHNYIYGNQGMQKEPAFQELLKLIFCKVYDEDTSTGEMRFYISNEDRRAEIGQRRLRERLNELFNAVKERYPYIFETGEQLRLESRVLAYVVSELQRFSLLQTEADFKGQAYEELVGANLRGDRGEFFTPRNVCEMAAEMVLATYRQDKWLSLRVLDPTCGTGGFLVAMMNHWRAYAYQIELNKFHDEGRAATRAADIVKNAAQRQLFGIDFNPVLVRAAQMNLVMHGDGSTNVFHINSLLPPGEWPNTPQQPVKDKIKLNSFDIILTNPPFGSKIPIDDAHLLEQFSLARFEMENGQRRASMPPEQIFIERNLQLLKPGGRLAIVLPDSILSNPGLAFIRRWILQRARVIASIDLPQVTFEPHTGTQTSVLLLQKKTDTELQIERETARPRDYEVFMATPQAVGHDRRGGVEYLRTPEGEIIEYVKEYDVSRKTANGQVMVERKHQKTKAKHDQLPEVALFFREWAGKHMRWLNG
ncbi:MAG: N-6 DNA methylase [Anaerolineae bacterium]|nr:N-6 DNA methylase [Anaerolineae bacterium]